MTEWVTSGAELTPDVPRAVEALELQNDWRRLVQIYCPGHGAGGGDRAGVVYSTLWGPLLVGEMPFPVPQDLIRRAFRVESDPAVPDTPRAEPGVVTIGPSGDGAYRFPPPMKRLPEPPAYLIESETRIHLTLQAECGRLEVLLADVRAISIKAQRLLDAGRPKVLKMGATRLPKSRLGEYLEFRQRLTLHAQRD